MKWLERHNGCGHAVHIFQCGRQRVGFVIWMPPMKSRPEGMWWAIDWMRHRHIDYFDALVIAQRAVEEAYCGGGPHDHDQN